MPCKKIMLTIRGNWGDVRMSRMKARMFGPYIGVHRNPHVGPVKIPLEAAGPCGGRNEFWIVTHAPTGRALFASPSFRDCVRFAEAVRKLGDDLNFKSLKDEKWQKLLAFLSGTPVRNG